MGLWDDQWDSTLSAFAGLVGVLLLDALDAI